MMWEAITQIDGAILLWIQENLRVDFLNGFWKFITHLGDDGYLWIAIGILLLFFKKTRTTGVTVLISLLFSLLINNEFLKKLVERPRPFVTFSEIVPLIPKPRSFSFPSGHSSGSFSAAMVLLYMLPKKYGVPAVVLAAMIAFSRMYVGVHYPADVIVGTLVGIMNSVLAYYLVKYVGELLKKKKDMK